MIKRSREIELEKDWYSVAEVAVLVDCSKQYVYELIEERHIPREEVEIKDGRRRRYKVLTAGVARLLERKRLGIDLKG